MNSSIWGHFKVKMHMSSRDENLIKMLIGNQKRSKTQILSKRLKDTILVKYSQFRLFMPLQNKYGVISYRKKINSKQLSTVAFKNALLFDGISRGSNVGYAKLM